jgi:hypothetical protein
MSQAVIGWVRDNPVHVAVGDSQVETCHIVEEKHQIRCCTGSKQQRSVSKLKYRLIR